MNRNPPTRTKGTTEKRDRLIAALRVLRELPTILEAYEATGDHDHSWGGVRPIPVGGACPGGDCLVAEARAIVAVMGGK